MNHKKRHDPELDFLLGGGSADSALTHDESDPACPYWPYDVSAADLCEKFLRISQTKLGTLVRNGIAIKSSRGRYRLDETVGNYVRHLQIVAAGRENTATQAEQKSRLAESRLRYSKAAARKIELQIAEREGSLVDAKAAQARMEGVCLQIRAAMLTVPSRAGQSLAGLTKAQIVALDAVVRDALASASEGVFNE